jgi:hypothetical protein
MATTPGLLRVRQRTEQAGQILVPVAHVPTLITGTQSRDVDPPVTLAEFIGGQSPQVLDRRDRIDQRRGPPGAGKHGEGQQTEQEA